ncbi:MAG: hypothetical protein JKY53_02725 [Flavobacteriales bacterium]|nr:hypothetical protein [Flavobacteriales bacterium]
MKYLYFIIPILIISCNQPSSSAIQKAKEDNSMIDSALVEKILIDLNNDNSLDTIKLKTPPYSGDPGVYLSIEIELANGTSFKNSTNEIWSTIDTFATKGLVNEIKSDNIFCTSFNSSKYLFLFEYQFASDATPVSIIKITQKSIKAIFDKSFEIEKIIDVDNNGSLDIIGREVLVEFYYSTDSVLIGTYSPFSVYSLHDEAVLQVELSKKYSKERYLYAGTSYNSQIKVAYPQKGKNFRPYLILDN